MRKNILNRGFIPAPILILINVVILSVVFVLMYQNLNNTKVPSYEVKGTTVLSEYLNNQTPGKEVKLTGVVKNLNKLKCPCFILVSNDDGLVVWHGLIETPDESRFRSVDMTRVREGDRVLVTGAQNIKSGNFELKEIKKITDGY